MPSFRHDAFLQLFRNQPELVPRLARELLGLQVPRYREVRIEEADFTEPLPTEYRADLEVSLAGERPVMGFVVELERSRDDRKRFSWPVYAASLHARLRCQVCLLVVTDDPAVAEWAARPIATVQPGSPFVPLVLGPEQIPRIRDAGEAAARPELAVLSALAHGRGAHRERRGDGGGFPRRGSCYSLL